MLLSCTSYRGMSFLPIKGFQDDSTPGPGHLRLIDDPAGAGNLGVTELCSTTPIHGLEVKVG